MEIAQSWCLVTGAARGIGRATAEALAERGASLVLCDQHTEEVDAFAQGLRDRGHPALSYGVDVGNLEEMQTFAAWVQEEVGGVDILVNNAGILRAGPFLETDVAEIRALFEVNFWGVVHAIQLFAPAMVARGRGAIIQVASASGRLGFESLGAYGSSKFAVVGLTQSLALELRGTGVQVSAVCPGLVRTDIVAGAGVTAEEAARYEAALKERGQPASHVADAIVWAIESKRLLVDVGWDARMVGLVARLSPTRAPRWVSRVAKRLAPRGSPGGSVP